MNKRKMPYYTSHDMDGNEALFEQAIEELKTGKCSVASEYPRPLKLTSGEKILASAVIAYCDRDRKFDYDDVVGICEAIRKLHPLGFREIDYHLGLWIESTMRHFFVLGGKQMGNSENLGELKAGVDISCANHDFARFMCYVAVSLIKYGASYQTVTADKYFKMVGDLGFDDVKVLKTKGTGMLPADVIGYKDEDVVCKANDVFATIDINIKNETEEAYEKALDFVLNLLNHDFPKSFGIKCRSKNKEYLPIKGLPKKGANLFFAQASKFPKLHLKIEKYARKVMHKDEWYTDIAEEQCMLPSSFAVFALGLYDQRYFGLVEKYMDTCDDEHQSLQLKFVPSFVEKYGVSRESLPVIVSCFFSFQNVPPMKAVVDAFANEEALELLKEYKKEKLYTYGVTKDRLDKYRWRTIAYCICGREPERGIKKFPAECQALWAEMLEE